MSENKKDLKYFMRNTETEIVTAPGPSSFKDENGKVIQFEIKVLSQEQINKINDAYRRKSMATDKKGKICQTYDCRGFAVSKSKKQRTYGLLWMCRYYRYAFKSIFKIK